MQKINGKTVTFKVNATNEEKRGIYGVDRVEYQYGDSQEGTNERGMQDVSHTYVKAGAYTVRAHMVMDVAPGSDIGAPFKDEHGVPCTSTKVMVK